MILSFDSPESSTIVRVNYDDESQIMIVEFKSSGQYHYFDVPLHVFEAMQNSSSRGQFLSQEIKNRYRYSRA